MWGWLLYWSLAGGGLSKTTNTSVKAVGIPAEDRKKYLTCRIKVRRFKA